AEQKPRGHLPSLDSRRRLALFITHTHTVARSPTRSRRRRSRRTDRAALRLRATPVDKGPARDSLATTTSEDQNEPNRDDAASIPRGRVGRRRRREERWVRRRRRLRRQPAGEVRSRDGEHPPHAAQGPSAGVEFPPREERLLLREEPADAQRDLPPDPHGPGSLRNVGHDLHQRPLLDRLLQQRLESGHGRQQGRKVQLDRLDRRLHHALLHGPPRRRTLRRLLHHLDPHAVLQLARPHLDGLGGVAGAPRTRVQLERHARGDADHVPHRERGDEHLERHVLGEAVPSRAAERRGGEVLRVVRSGVRHGVPFVADRHRHHRRVQLRRICHIHGFASIPGDRGVPCRAQSIRPTPDRPPQGHTLPQGDVPLLPPREAREGRGPRESDVQARASRPEQPPRVPRRGSARQIRPRVHPLALDHPLPASWFT
ncbi:hypothetical protein ACHAWF_013247, partial [Thalassiosira exigua]